MLGFIKKLRKENLEFSLKNLPRSFKNKQNIAKIISTEKKELTLINGEQIEYVLMRDSFATLRLRIRRHKPSLFPEKEQGRKKEGNTESHENNGLYTIEVKASKKYKQDYIESFLHKKADWIVQKTKEVMERGEIPGIDFKHSASFFCLGKRCYFFYKHPILTKNLPSFEKKIFGNHLAPWEAFAFEPVLLKETILSGNAILPVEKQTNKIVQNVATDYNNVSQALFLAEEDMYAYFWEMGNNVQKNFTLKYQEIQSPPSSKYPVLYIKVKKEDIENSSYEHNITPITQQNSLFSLIEKKEEKCHIQEHCPQENRFDNSDAKENFSTQNPPSDTYEAHVESLRINLQEKYASTIRLWRKKSAELFLNLCFDRVWEGLCGRNTKNNISVLLSQEIQNFFNSLQKPALKVKHLTRRFGSCTNRAREVRPEISLAVNLVGFPLSCIEYVIIHECCHLKYMNHSKDFYALLENCCPNSLQKRDFLWEWSQTHPHF